MVEQRIIGRILRVYTNNCAFYCKLQDLPITVLFEQTGNLTNAEVETVLDNLKTTLLGLDYNYFVGNHVNNPKLSLCICNLTGVRVFNPETGEEIEDVEGLKTTLASMGEEGDYVCGPDYDGPDPVNYGFSVPLHGQAKPPFSYLEFDENNNVIIIHEEQPTTSDYVVSTRFKPGDENVYDIKILARDGNKVLSLSAIKK